MAVWQEDVEDKLVEAEDTCGGIDDAADEETLAHAREQHARLQACGAMLAFSGLPEFQQRAYAEVSLLELSAFACFRRARLLGREASESAAGIEGAWNALDCDDKAEWLLEEPREELEKDGQWMALLEDGPTPCGVIHR
mmetsp:Transcript_59926/g.107853  ORF Transcript_59926/g.107853 Transcript_59926/m.107853 type:complete len:139 (-) Transcript_59926:203-619(-)